MEFFISCFSYLLSLVGFKTTTPPSEPETDAVPSPEPWKYRPPPPTVILTEDFRPYERTENPLLPQDNCHQLRLSQNRREFFTTSASGTVYRVNPRQWKSNVVTNKSVNRVTRHIFSWGDMYLQISVRNRARPIIEEEKARALEQETEEERAERLAKRAARKKELDEWLASRPSRKSRKEIFVEEMNELWKSKREEKQSTEVS